jgi:RND superfamily putative drug exporter
MTRLAEFCSRRRFTVLGAWLIFVIAVGGVAVSIGANYTNSTTMPHSESASAYELLAKAGAGGGESSAGDAGTIVWESTGADVNSAEVRQQMSAVLTQVADLAGVVSVVSPYTKAGAAQLNTTADVAYAAVTIDDSADLDQINAVARSADSATLQVETGGQAFTVNPAAGGITEIIGVVAALIILLLIFRSIWAAVLPIVTGVVGVVVSLFLIMIASHVIDLSDSTPTMGSLIGLAVGIDYALFIVNRHRKALMAGRPLNAAIAQAVNTSGRAVLFAGGTVVIALLGMFVVQVSVLTGMARGAALTVVMTVFAALTLLPALLAVMGDKVLSRRQRAELRARATEPMSNPASTSKTALTSNPKQTVMQRWAGQVQRRPRILAAVGVVLLLALAVPALSIRLGSADASSDPSDTSTNAYYTMVSKGFGEGFDASLLVVASTPDAASAKAFTALTRQLKTVPDVAAVSVTPVAKDAHVQVVTVIPEHSAQTVSTADLVNRIRDDIPSTEKGTDLKVYVGGTTASNIDSSASVAKRLPLYLIVIALLGFALLVVAFRSILVPLIGALANLLTLAVGLGAVTAIFQFGWGSALIGVGSSAPIEWLVPVMVIGVMFGLSMDYQVFLVSRMHEEWTHTHDNARAVRVGLAETGVVITTAALIMVSIFASFGFSGQRIVAEIGMGLAVAVLADAFVLRLTVVSALMHLIGDRNWAYPRWLDRITPHVSVEGAPAPAVAVAVATAGATAGGAAAAGAADPGAAVSGATVSGAVLEGATVSGATVENPELWTMRAHMPQPPTTTPGPGEAAPPQYQGSDRPGW